MPSIGKRFRRKDFLPLIESDVPILKQGKAEYAKLQWPKKVLRCCLLFADIRTVVA